MKNTKKSKKMNIKLRNVSKVNIPYLVRIFFILPSLSVCFNDKGVRVSLGWLCYEISVSMVNKTINNQLLNP